MLSTCIIFLAGKNANTKNQIQAWIAQYKAFFNQLSMLKVCMEKSEQDKS